LGAEKDFFNLIFFRFRFCVPAYRKGGSEDSLSTGKF